MTVVVAWDEFTTNVLKKNLEKDLASVSDKRESNGQCNNTIILEIYCHDFG